MLKCLTHVAANERKSQLLFRRTDLYKDIYLPVLLRGKGRAKSDKAFISSTPTALGVSAKMLFTIWDSRDPMAPRSVRSACDRESSATFSIGNWIGKIFLFISSSSVLWKAR
jgi:hypothetical protein